MAERMLRRGLPRIPGGEPWPPADVAADVDEAVADAPASAASTADAARPTNVPNVPDVAEVPGATDAADSAPATDAALMAALRSPSQASGLRRGLPRVVGGEPWPPAGAGSEAASVAADSAPVAAPVAAAVVAASTAASPDHSQSPAPAADDTAVRRGLPRVVGGDPWPPVGTAPLRLSDAATSSTGSEAQPLVADTVAVASGTDAATVAPDAAAPVALLGTDINTPLPSPSTAWNGRAPRHIPAGPASARRRPTWPQAIAALMGAAALGVIAGAGVAVVRTLLSLPFMQDFLAAFPGEYEPAIAVAPGFAPWIGWQHFFNAFLIVLIIRSGLTIRNEKRPTAFWTPRNNSKGKVSLTIWFHQALDVLWLVNGVIFIVLLFLTGHWLRIVPTSWEVIPNALSAALQYVSFDWPTEHGWVNYNSLQQLAYFATVFIAAPLAAVTGFRMSGMWPAKAERLSKAYPIEWARAVHFPVMIYFVVFIIGHVALVFLTGFLRNLNHMYASSDAATWTGFWVFVASLAVIAAGWVAARPLVIAPIAKLFGNVSSR